MGDDKAHWWGEGQFGPGPWPRGDQNILLNYMLNKCEQRVNFKQF
jgi:hypothetical protein